MKKVIKEDKEQEEVEVKSVPAVDSNQCGVCKGYGRVSDKESCGACLGTGVVK